MVPATALLVPRFAIFRALGLTDTLVPLVAPALLGTSPLYVLVYYLAFRALPGRPLRRLPDRGPHAAADLVAGGDAAGAAGHRRPWRR